MPHDPTPDPPPTGARMVPVSFSPGTEIAAPPSLVETLDLLHRRGGGTLFWPFSDPPCILLSLAGRQVFDDVKRLSGSTPFRVQFALCDTAAGPVTILELHMFDTPRESPLVMTCYLNPLEPEEREALFKVLETQHIHLVFFEHRTVQRLMVVSTAGQTGQAARLIQSAVRQALGLHPPEALDWEAALEQARRFWERGQG